MADLHEMVAATIHGQEVSVHELLSFLKIHESLGFITDALHKMVIAQAAGRAGITVREEELQTAAEHFRQARRLYSAAETLQWLKERHMTVHDLEVRLEQALMAEKLRQQVTAGQIERYFAEHKSDFDTARMAHIVVLKEGVAHELYSQLTEEEADFATLARKYSLESTSKDAGGYVGIVRRKALSPAVEAAVFTAQAGAIVGPVKTDMGYHVIQVQALYPSGLDAPTKAAIADLLFADWLHAEVRQANITLPLLQQL